MKSCTHLILIIADNKNNCNATARLHQPISVATVQLSLVELNNGMRVYLLTTALK